MSQSQEKEPSLDLIAKTSHVRSEFEIVKPGSRFTASSVEEFQRYVSRGEAIPADADLKILESPKPQAASGPKPKRMEIR